MRLLSVHAENNIGARVGLIRKTARGGGHGYNNRSGINQGRDPYSGGPRGGGPRDSGFRRSAPLLGGGSLLYEQNRSSGRGRRGGDGGVIPALPRCCKSGKGRSGVQDSRASCSTRPCRSEMSRSLAPESTPGGNGGGGERYVAIQKQAPNV